MARRAFLGIDCGTQSTKVVLVDPASEEVLGFGRGAHELVERADGTREQDPEWWIAALKAAMRQALASTGEVEIAGIGGSGQQHGLGCLGAAGRALPPAKLWNDTTPVAECEQLLDSVGGPARALALTGNTFLVGYT